MWLAPFWILHGAICCQVVPVSLDPSVGVSGTFPDSSRCELLSSRACFFRSLGWGEWHLSGFFTVRAAVKSCLFLRFLFVLSPHVARHFEILSDFFFTKSYTILTNMAHSLFYSTKCDSVEITNKMLLCSALPLNALACEVAYLFILFN